MAARELGAEPPVRPARRGLIGPFSGRQLGLGFGVIVLAAVALSLATRPLGTTDGGPAVPPAPTAYIVGPATEGLRPGQQAPELAITLDDGTTAAITDLDGNVLTLEGLRGRLVWVNFWASWCPPCQFETPTLREMDEAYRDRGLTIVAIAVQETTVEDVRAYADRYELGFPIAFDARADIFDRYQVNALPTQFFIGPDGRILEVIGGPLTAAAATIRIERWLPAAAG